MLTRASDGFVAMTPSLATLSPSLRLHTAEAPVLQDVRVDARPPGADRTRQAVTSSRRRGPVLIEIFPKHDDFAV